MPDQGATPAIVDIYRLSDQIQADRERPVMELRQRDHAIGARCSTGNDVGRLQFWLTQVQGERPPESAGWLNERNTAVLMRAAAATAGFLTMAGFLLASDRALVNVFFFLLLFVLLQLVSAIVALVVMLLSSWGNPPAVFPLNPARLVAARALPASAELSESAGVVRLLLLRYGQEFAAVFTLGAVLAFLCLLAFTDFSFVWGSTFGPGDEVVLSMTRTLAAPWSGWLPAASPSAEIIADTRYHPSQLDLASMRDDSRRGWWPFLLMCMMQYALVPRLLLWFASRVLYRRAIRRALVTLPGAAAVLTRMRAPVVETRAPDAEERDLSPMVEIDEGVMLLDWAGAVGEDGVRGLGGLSRVAPDNRLSAGLGSPDTDAAVVAAINAYRPEILLVAVRAWEPPMADLEDVLAGVQGVPRCTLCLVPLPDKSVSEHAIEEWQGFTRKLSFPATRVETLQWQ